MIAEMTMQVQLEAQQRFPRALWPAAGQNGAGRKLLSVGNVADVMSQWPLRTFAVCEQITGMSQLSTYSSVCMQSSRFPCQVPLQQHKCVPSAQDFGHHFV